MQQENALRGRAARHSASTTAVEHFVDPARPVVSRTDLKGKITYVNRAFVEISGFSEDELIGAPHNLVRHPDMPREAFKDMWDTLHGGRPWRGIVKNRCKNGDFYWVDAYVSVLTRDGRPVGFMSVRAAPTEAGKRAAEQLYADVRAGRASVPRTRDRFGRSIRSILGAVCAGAAALGVLAGVLPQPWSAVAGAALVLGSAAVYVALSRLVNGSVSRLRAEMCHISEGDLTFDREPEGPHEFADLLVALRSMKVNLRAVLADVVVSAGDVQAGARSLADRAESVRARSRQQADGVTDVAAAVEEMTVSVGEISDATHRSAEHASRAISVVGEGGERMDESLSATREVVTVVEAARGQIGKLSDAVGNISSVTRTIQEIAEQTSLLALNAAIEAARAGEQGRGFAVVADEVRKLAERTHASTMEISRTIGDVQAGTQGVTVTMQTVTDKVSQGAGLIHATNESLHAIREASQGVGATAQEIATMLEQQSRAASEVSANMERMSALTEENVEAIGHVDGSSHELATIAQDLHKLLGHFRLGSG